MIVVGVGCSRGCTAEELAALVDAALSDTGNPDVAALATIDLKAGEPAITKLAATRGWRIELHAAAALAAQPVPTPSSVVAAHVGTPSVAEAAALLSARTDTLLLAKRRSAHATVALAHLRP